VILRDIGQVVTQFLKIAGSLVSVAVVIMLMRFTFCTTDIAHVLEGVIEPELNA